MSTRWGRLGADRWGLAIGVVALAVALLHVAHLGGSPPGLYQDEATNGYQAWALAHYGRDEHGHLLPLYLETFGDWKSPLYVYLLAPFTYVLPLTAATIRLPAALCALVACSAVTAAAHWRTRSAVITILTLAGAGTMPWLLVAGRTALESVTLPACLAVALACLARVEAGGGGRWYAGAGAALGLTALTYPSGLVLAGPLTLVVLATHARRDGRAVLAVLAVPAAVYVLVGAWMVRHPGALANRPGAISIARDHPGVLVVAGRFAVNYLEHLGPVFLLVRGDANPRQATEFGGLVLLAMAPAVVAGLVVAVRRRRPLDLTLLATLVLAPVPSAVTDEGIPHALRAVAMVPPLLLLAATGWEVVLPWLAAHRRAAVALAGLAALQVALVVADLELTWPGRAEGSFDAGYDTAVTDAARLAGGHAILLSSTMGVLYAHALVDLQPPPGANLGATLAHSDVRTVDPAHAGAVTGDILVLGSNDPAPPHATLIEEVRVPTAYWGSPVVAARLYRGG
ncbi:MAG TPA: glycosyltransferase family 39 protein [Candidatus Dormibacteraeota bacterium]